MYKIINNKDEEYLVSAATEQPVAFQVVYAQWMPVIKCPVSGVLGGKKRRSLIRIQVTLILLVLFRTYSCGQEILFMQAEAQTKIMSHYS